jgi:TPR repeat protein
LGALAAAARGAGLAAAKDPPPPPAPPPPQPALAADLKAAMAKADAGHPDEMLKLADANRADAQFYVGTAYLFGGHGLRKDPTIGCAYVEKAAATRGDAAFLAGRCFQAGLGGTSDPVRAKAAYQHAADLGYPKAKCALGQMLLSEKTDVEHALTLCKEPALAGDVDAQAALGDAYFNGTGVKVDHRQARKWYEMAAPANTRAARRLGEMYVKGDGGKKDVKKAIELWTGAEKKGDPLASILIADQFFSELTGGQKPGAGKYAFRGGIPVSQIETTEAWYREAQRTDPRPEVRQRAGLALNVLNQFKAAAKAVPAK